MRGLYVVVASIITIFSTAYLTHAYDIHHDLCGHFDMIMNGVWEDLPVINPKLELEE